MAAEALESDLDLAFNLQLQEAINASLSSSFLSPETQPKATTQNDDFLDFNRLKFEPELNDHVVPASDFKRTRDDLQRQIHDRRVARELSRIPENQWQESGEHFERPYGEGSSKEDNEETFRVYVKGLLEMDLQKHTVLGGIGVAIFDSEDELLFKMRKPLNGNAMSRRIVEARALFDGLNAAKELGLNGVVYYCDYLPIFNYAMGLWTPKRQKDKALVKELAVLQGQFSHCKPSLMAQNDFNFAFKFAREAILSQMDRPEESKSSATINLSESCAICLEEKVVGQFFSVNECRHRYCLCCMKQHIEVKLLHGMLPKCPHEGCNTELKIDSCRKFLTPRLIEIMSQLIKENAIPVTEKVYCPYPKCSALMSKTEVLEYSKSISLRAEISGDRKCLICKGDFCINCKVPWHYNMSCHDFKQRNPFPSAEDVKLKNLATTQMWRQCVKCNHMIELAAGCFHMTCRCGYEFCYTCGAEWKNKAATCSCPLWDEDNIVNQTDDESDDEEDDYDYGDDEEVPDYVHVYLADYD